MDHVPTASSSQYVEPTSHRSLWPTQAQLLTVGAFSLCIFGYTLPLAWNDLSLNLCHFQDSLLHEALPDNHSPFELSLLLPTSVNTKGFMSSD